MSALYTRNKFFDHVWWVGAEVLGDFEDVVHVDEVVFLSKTESYEVAIDESWPQFIQDFCF